MSDLGAVPSDERAPFVYGVAMAQVTEDDRSEAVQRLLAGIANGTDANDLAAQIADLHPEHDTFPGEVFIELGAEALTMAGLNRGARVEHEGLLLKHLPEATFKGKQNRRIQYTLFATFAVNGGLEPDLLEEVSFWIDDFWYYALLAAVTVIRASAEQADIEQATFARQLATSHGVELI